MPSKERRITDDSVESGLPTDRDSVEKKVTDEEVRTRSPPTAEGIGSSCDALRIKFDSEDSRKPASGTQ